MRGVYAIARHEFVRRWALVLVGFGLGLMGPFFRDPYSQNLTPFGDTLFTISVVVCWVIAFATGLSLIGRPLHDGRLAFYFTRPVTSAGIAIGKIVGGLVAVTCMHVAFAVFSPEVSKHLQPPRDNDLAGVATFIGIAFFVVGLVVGILARSRSRWFLADIAGAAVAALVAVGMFAAFSARKSAIARSTEPDTALALFHRANMFLYALVVAAAIALVVSVVVAITRGRTDRDLVHRGLSLTLWPALTGIALVGVGLAQWGLS